MSKIKLLIGAFVLGLSSLLPGQRAWEGRYVAFNIANDILVLPVKTDQYFTSGLTLELGRIENTSSGLLANNRATHQRYWRLTQNIFTPKEIESSDLLTDDRPFASYFVISRGQAYHNPDLGFHLTSEWTAGVLGKYAMGEQAQNAFHNIVNFAEPLPGWRNEVKPDIILNYRLRLEQRYALGSRAALTTALDGRLGTLHTDVAPEVGFNLQLIRLSATKSLTFKTFVSGRFVAHNATLTGGPFNRDERFRDVIKPDVFVRTFGIDGFIDLNALRLQGGFRYLSREFVGGDSHMWAWMGVRVMPGRG